MDDNQKKNDQKGQDNKSDKTAKEKAKDKFEGYKEVIHGSGDCAGCFPGVK